jgi:C_GCAxxG_C_C family probable redox protein
MKQRVRELAEDSFVKGLNCAESVYTALLEAGLINFPPETVAMATGFGGGIGISGCGVCGALSAAVMTVGAVHGRHTPAQGTPQEIKDGLWGNPGLYRFFNLLAHKFENRFGSALCVELIKDYSNFFVEERFCKCMNLLPIRLKWRWK